MSNPIIGVTERGDAALDLSWAQRMDEVDGAVIITKNITWHFRDAILPFAEKTILHATTTGWGGTDLEPGVPSTDVNLKKVVGLVNDGFPREHVVIRVDPVIPTKGGIRRMEAVFHTAYEFGFRRFRVSLLDMYPHVVKRFEKEMIPPPYRQFSAPDEWVKRVDIRLGDLKRRYRDIVIEACAEGSLKNVRHCGCVSEYDLNILGLEFDDDAQFCGYQRKGCMCYAGKKELLTSKRPCEHNCLYCFWKRDDEI